jgi:hypothetical protein
VEALKTMDLTRLNELETIDPIPLAPRRTEPFANIAIEPNREVGRNKAKTIRATDDDVVYSYASGRQGHLSACTVALNDNMEVTESQQIQVGPMDRWSVHAAELLGIF